MDEAVAILSDIVEARRRQFERLRSLPLSDVAMGDVDEALVALRLAELELLREKRRCTGSAS